MFEIHGWCNVSESFREEDDDEELKRKIVADLSTLVRDINGSFAVDLKWKNGNAMLWAHGISNHRSQDCEEILDLFHEIPKRAIGSYGLLYVWDDEDWENDNRFRVWKIAKGRIIEAEDSFLSPCIPTIDEPWI